VNDSGSEAVDVRAHVAAEVRAELARRRISARQAARRLGWGVTATHRRVTGESPIDVQHLHEIAEMLDTPVGDFFPPRRRAGGGSSMTTNTSILALAS